MSVRGSSKRNVFKILYLGNTAVTLPRGDDIALAAMAAVSSACRGSQKVVLETDPQALKVTICKNQELVVRTPGKHVSYCGFNREKRMLCFIESRVNALTGERDYNKCYVFLVKSHLQNMADTIVSMYGLARDRPRESIKQVMRDVKRGEIAVFEGRFLGSIPVTVKEGDEVVRQAIAYLREQAMLHAGNQGAMGNHVVIVLSTEGIRTLDSLTRSVINNIFVENISFTCVADRGEAHEIFSCISFDERLERACCYVYNCVAGQADLICDQVQYAIETSRADLDDETFDPFAGSVVQSRVEVPSQLLKYHVHREYLAAVKPVAVGQFGKIFFASYAPPEVDEGDSVGVGGTGPNAGESGVSFRAVKLLRSSASSNNRSDFLKVIETMGQLRDHENVLRLVGCNIIEDPWLMVQEFAQYGDLHSVLLACREKLFHMTAQEVSLFGRQICSGMDYIHKQRIVHMDLAAKSCLLHCRSTIKISDFGIAMPYDADQDFYSLNGRLKLSLRWLAPETYALEKKHFDEKSDVWSFGITFWEIICYGTTPYGKLPLNEVHHLVPKGLRLRVPEKCPAEIKDILNDCWAEVPSHRGTFTELGDRLQSLVERYAADGQQVRDIGASLNRVLSKRLQTMSVKACTLRKVRNEHRMSMDAGTLLDEGAASMETSGVSDFVRRTNPLFGCDIVFDDDDDDDDDDGDSENDNEDSGQDHVDTQSAPSKETRHNPSSVETSTGKDGNLNPPSLLLKSLAAKGSQVFLYPQSPNDDIRDAGMSPDKALNQRTDVFIVS